MHHLDIVAGAVVADPVAARRAVIDLGRDGLENVLHVRPGVGMAARHDRWPASRALFAAGDAGADEQQPAGAQVLGAPDGVLIQRVAPVDDDVARLEVRDDAIDDVVHRLPRLDEHHHAARPLEVADHFLDRVGTDDVGAFGLVVEEIVHLGDGAVVGHDGEAVVVHVEDQVLPHDGQPDHRDVSLGFHFVFFWFSRETAGVRRRPAWRRGFPSAFRWRR